jgi:uncharacterized protein (TIGR02265 family)
LQQVKGAVIRSRLGFVEEHFGKDAVGRVLEALSHADREALGTVLSTKWYPFDLGRRLDDAIVGVLGGGDDGLFERLGAASADRNLTTVHQAFLTPGDPHAFLGKARAIYALYYETGRREYQRTGPDSGVLTTYDAETFSAADCLTVVGWYRRAMELCGVAGVRITEEECRARGGAVCRYRVEWGRS